MSVDNKNQKIVRKTIDINEDSFKMLKLISTLENFDSFKKYLEKVLEDEVIRKKELLKDFIEKQ